MENEKDFNSQFNEDNENERITEEIINIGHGIYESKTQRDEKLNKYKEKEALENRREWAELSRRSESFAKFNPYIKENLNRMIALEIYREFEARTELCANMCTLSEDEVRSNLDSIKSEMVRAFEERGLEPSEYHEFVERLNADSEDIYAIYTKMSKVYMYDTLIKKHGEDLAFILNKNLSDTENVEDIQNARFIIEDKIVECEDSGIPDNDIFNIILSGIRNFISERGEKFSVNVLISSLENLQIGKLKISDFVPDLKSFVQNVKIYAVNEHSKIIAKQIDTENFIFEQNRNLALKEFLHWYKSNKQAYPQDIDNFINGLIQKYNIQGESYLSFVLDRKSVLKNYINLNPYVLCELERRSFNGTLGIMDIEGALMSGFIGVNDGIRLIENTESDIKPEVIEFELFAANKISDEKLSERLYMKRNLITVNLAKGLIKLADAEKQLSELKGEK